MRGLMGMTARRARTQAWVLLAAFLSVLAASTALTTIAAFASATRQQTVVRMVGQAASAQPGITLSDSAGGIDATAAQPRLDEDVRAYLPELSASTYSAFYSQLAQTRLSPATVFWASPQLPAHAKVLSGRMPVATRGSDLEVAVTQGAAAQFHLELGSTYRLDSFGSRGSVTVVGIYRPDAATDPYTAFTQASLAAQDSGLALYVPAGDFDGATINPGSCDYLIRPDLSGLNGGDLDAVSASVDRLVDVLAADQNLGAQASVQTPLTSLLDGAVQALSVARTAIAIPSVLLIAVAGFALAFTARLLTAGRRTGTALMLARGARPRQLAACGALEAAVLCGLAQIPALFLAGPLAGLVSTEGAVPGFGSAVWAAAIAAWLAGTAILAAYAAQRPVDVERTRGAAVLGLGAEAALVLLGGLALWELASHGPAEAAQGLIDPVVVLAPAIAVLAAAVLCLRLIPFAGRGTQWFAARARSWAAPYGAWSAARAGRASTGPVVLLVMAIGTVVLSSGYLAASERSALDQADYSVGTDVRLTGVDEQRLPTAGTAAALPYVAGAVALTRLSAAIGADSSEGPTQILIADPAQLARAGELRTDLGPDGIRGLTDPLISAAAQGRVAAEPGLSLPGRPRELSLGLGLTGPATGGASLELTFDSAAGESESLYVTVPAGAAARIEVNLGLLYGNGAQVAWPLRLTRLNLLLNGLPPGAAAPGLALQTASVDGAPTVLPASEHWSYTVSRDQGTTVVSATTSPAAAPASIGAVATPGFLSASGKHVGDTAVIVYQGTQIPVHILGEADAIPTIDPSGNGLLLDKADADAYAQTGGLGLVGDLEWWLRAQPGHVDQLAAEAAGARLGGTELDRLSVREDYTDDPVRTGPTGALEIAAVAVALLALIGFATRLVSEVRYRAREIAIARALGLDPGRVALAFGVQQAFEAVVAVLGGCVIGVLLAERVVPLTIVARDGTAAVPAPVAVSPWPTVLGSAGAALLCVLGASCFVGYVASRLSISTLLRTESAASR